eukprot:609861-Rhodomonas_salina.1
MLCLAAAKLFVSVYVRTSPPGWNALILPLPDSDRATLLGDVTGLIGLAQTKKCKKASLVTARDGI